MALDHYIPDGVKVVITQSLQSSGAWVGAPLGEDGLGLWGGIWACGGRVGGGVSGMLGPKAIGVPECKVYW